MTIKATRTNPDHYRSLVDCAILNAIARGLTQFDQLIRACRVTEVGDIGQRFQPKEHQVLVLG
jgi:hypothetical protein